MGEESYRSQIEWPEAAPDALIGGVQVGRSLLVSVDPSEQDPCDDLPEQTSWDIWCVPVRHGSQLHLVFVGDYSQTSGHLRAAASASVRVILRNDLEKLAEQEIQNAAETYAPWVSHVLWDTIRQHILTLLAGSPAPPEVPILTPPFRLGTGPETTEEAPAGTTDE